MKIDGVTMKRPLYSIDYSALKMPMAKILYVDDEKKFGHDEKHTDKMLDALDAIRDAEHLLLEKHANAIKDGDVALRNNDCPLARKNYETAINLIPEPPYDEQPRIKLTQADKCVKEKEEAALAKANQETAKKAAEEKAATEKAANENLARENAAKEAREKSDREAAERAKKAESEKLSAEKAASDAAAEKAEKIKKEELARQVAREKELKSRSEAGHAAREKQLAEEKAAEEKNRTDNLKKQQAAENARIAEAASGKDTKATAPPATTTQAAPAQATIAEKKDAGKRVPDAVPITKQDVKFEKQQGISPGQTFQRESPQGDKKETIMRRKNAIAVGRRREGRRKKGGSVYSMPKVIGSAEKYREAVKAGDAYFVMKQWAEAARSYREALVHKENDHYATRKIAEIEQIQK